MDVIDADARGRGDELQPEAAQQAVSEHGGVGVEIEAERRPGAAGGWKCGEPRRQVQHRRVQVDGQARRRRHGRLRGGEPQPHVAVRRHVAEREGKIGEVHAAPVGTERAVRVERKRRRRHQRRKIVAMGSEAPGDLAAGGHSALEAEGAGGRRGVLQRHCQGRTAVILRPGEADADLPHLAPHAGRAVDPERRRAAPGDDAEIGIRHMERTDDEAAAADIGRQRGKPGWRLDRDGPARQGPGQTDVGPVEHDMRDIDAAGEQGAEREVERQRASAHPHAVAIIPHLDALGGDGGLGQQAEPDRPADLDITAEEAARGSLDGFTMGVPVEQPGPDPDDRDDHHGTHKQKRHGPYVKGPPLLVTRALRRSQCHSVMICRSLRRRGSPGRARRPPADRAGRDPPSG